MTRVRMTYIVLIAAFAAACGGSGSSDPVTPSLAIGPTEWPASSTTSSGSGATSVWGTGW